MGLFKNKEICAVCNIGNGNTEFADGWVCKECLEEGVGVLPVFGHKNITVSRAKEIISYAKSRKARINDFNPDRKVTGYFLMDSVSRTWCVPISKNERKLTPLIYDYSDIIDFELLEDGDSITKGGLGRALVGGAFFGGIGAIVGGATGGKKTKETINELKIKISINSSIKSVEYIDLLIAKGIKKSSILYKTSIEAAREILSILDFMTNDSKEESKSREIQSNVQSSNSNVSLSDEIFKLKDLLDAGILNQEEFEKAKNKLLG